MLAFGIPLALCVESLPRNAESNMRHHAPFPRRTMCVALTDVIQGAGCDHLAMIKQYRWRSIKRKHTIPILTLFDRLRLRPLGRAVRACAGLAVARPASGMSLPALSSMFISTADVSFSPVDVMMLGRSFDRFELKIHFSLTPVQTDSTLILPIMYRQNKKKTANVKLFTIISLD